jgi:Na+/phosphate symporter
MTGLGITSVIQSSSATTVMVVGFVNAALLTLDQAIGVIMGANIGTTVTAWLVSLLGFKADISIFAVPLMAVGFIMSIAKKEKYKMIGTSTYRILVGIVLGLLGYFTINFALFKWKCNILAETIIEKLREEKLREELIGDYINIYTKERQNTVDQDFIDEDPRR